MTRYVIFYYLASEYDKVLVDARCLSDPITIADSFSCKPGAVVVGVYPELLLKKYYYE